MKKISYYFLVIIIAAAALVSFWTYQRYLKAEDVKLLSFTVKRGSMEEMVRVRGVASAPKEFDLEFSLEGRVEDILVEEGAAVVEGDALLSLDTTDVKIERGRLSAVLRQKQSNLDKILAGPTKEDLRIYETKVSNADQALADALRNLEEVTSKAQVDLQAKQDSLNQAQDNLDTVSAKADIDLDNAYGDVKSILNDAYLKADDALFKQLDDLFQNGHNGQKCVL